MTQLTSRKHLLLIDDDEDDFIILNEVLEAHFSSVTVTHLAHCDSVDKATFHGVDIVLLDINMPRVNGFECLDLIRRQYGLSGLPVVMYSNSFACRDIQVAYEKGANLFINKPGSFQKIKSVLDDLLSIDWTNIEEITRGNFESQKVLKY